VVGDGRPAGPAEVSAFHRAFDWPGTFDASAWLCVPDAIRWVGAQLSGGWPAVRERNRVLALDGRTRLCRALGVAPPAPDAMLGSMAAVPLPLAPAGAPGPVAADDLRDRLHALHRIVVPVIPWPRPPGRLVRVSAHLYNRPEHYLRLAEALTAEVVRERSGPAGG
jgi:isopenicillin-N epimerase